MGLFTKKGAGASTGGSTTSAGQSPGLNPSTIGTQVQPGGTLTDPAGIQPPWSDPENVPTARMMRKHKLYLFAWLGIGSALLDAAIIFGIQTGVFKGQSLPYFWKFPGAIAGNAVVTLVVTVILTWLIGANTVSADVRKKRMPPLSPSALRWWPPRSGTRIGRWFSVSHDMYWVSAVPRTRWPRTRAVFRNILRSLVLCIPIFLITWPIFIAITNPIWGNHGYGDWPVPEVALAIFGGVVGLLATPIVGIITLASIGQRIEEGRAAREATTGTLVPPGSYVEAPAAGALAAGAGGAYAVHEAKAAPMPMAGSTTSGAVPAFGTGMPTGQATAGGAPGYALPSGKLAVV